MKTLLGIVALGGPGSGCNGPNCGRPAGPGKPDAAPASKFPNLKFTKGADGNYTMNSYVL